MYAFFSYSEKKWESKTETRRRMIKWASQSQNSWLSSLLYCLYKLLPGLPTCCFWLMKTKPVAAKHSIFMRICWDIIAFTCWSNYGWWCKLINSLQTTHYESSGKSTNKTCSPYAQIKGLRVDAPLSAGLALDQLPCKACRMLDYEVVSLRPSFIY